MKRIITSEAKPIKLWTDEIESGALQQAKNLANLPFTYKWVAIMPDVHQGYGMPIGGVLATKEIIIPNAVGVDIGCGMCAVPTSLKSLSKKQLPQILQIISNQVPLGFKHHSQPQVWEGFYNAPKIPIIQQELDKARYQLGSLGGGNHFMEIQKGSDGKIWLMLHSGSRNFGLKIARRFHQKAKKFCNQKKYKLPTFDLAYLPLESRSAQDYLQAMNFALEFAKASRFAMLEKMKNSVREFIYNVQFGNVIDIPHNYAAWEEHYGQKVMVHRKGATSAQKGQLGIIPGSQGAKSYIVRGKGNPESFMSCSHGAGRTMSRRQARKQLNLAAEKEKLEKQHIIHSIKSNKDLDEATSAYKDISQVMQNQQDLVEIVVELTPLAVIKG
ncbi:MAG: RtcB family protein [Candidatus Cloacimonadota bacterium]|nr:RtcB family protein [Candidatus Cloacimonadota bacterium]